MLTPYDPKTERLMKQYFSRLPEKERRQYAAIEAQKLGFGGKMYISKLMPINRHALNKGIRELLDEDIYNQIPKGKQRRAGGGRKKNCNNPDTKTLLINYINSIKAGSPTDERVFWVCQKPKEIAQKFAQSNQLKVSHGTVKRLLLELGYRYRKQAKELPTGTCANRNLQFHIITILILSMSMQSPVISIDCKKKERLGNLYRDGKCYTQAPIKVYDHDYEHLAEGKVVPHGIYDLQANEGYISLGDSSETADFITDNLLWWWTQYGIHRYPDAGTILVLCDAGGGNSYRHHRFKDCLLRLSEEIGVSLLIVHHPPYASNRVAGAMESD